MTIARLSSLALCALLAHGAPALAQDDTTTAEPAPSDAEAKRLFDSGAELYEEGRYEQAIVAFREAYTLSKRHALLKNIANAQERLGDLEGAVATLNEYRIYADEETKASLETRVRVLEDRIAKERAAALAAEAAALEAAKAQAAAAPPAPAPEAAPERRPNTTKWVLMGTGAALTGGFGALTVISYTNGQNAADAGDESTYNNIRTLNNVSGAVAMAGGALLAVSVALPSSRAVSVAPTMGGLNLFGRF
jgi:TolA-binding protein